MVDEEYCITWFLNNKNHCDKERGQHSACSVFVLCMSELFYIVHNEWQ